MWLKWLPWRFIIAQAARATGFIDPLDVLSRLRNFAQPAEIHTPLELARAGAIFHARGLINTQAIQHNLDWVWPHWVERQFNPRDPAFIPRAFSLTHVNLTHRNWTAVGAPGCPAMPLLDPRGLLTPHFDGWSVELALLSESGEEAVPAQLDNVEQVLELQGNLSVRTLAACGFGSIMSRAKVELQEGVFVCILETQVVSTEKAEFIISLRPYNPEGISFIHEIEVSSDGRSWKINDSPHFTIESAPQRFKLSTYAEGDVLRGGGTSGKTQVKCDVGMASGAAFFPVPPGVAQSISLTIPLIKAAPEHSVVSWTQTRQGSARLNIPDPKYQFLYDASLATLTLLTPDDFYPGPYTYKRFWFRDAVFMAHAMLCAGCERVVRGALQRFLPRQLHSGYFRSQEGEWDSNGEVLWLYLRWMELSGDAGDERWHKAICKGAEWLIRHRRPYRGRAGERLMPAGFSAEHLGPPDFYYWDNFWGCAGLDAASKICGAFYDSKNEARYAEAARDYRSAIESSLAATQARLGRPIIPAAPGRRMDSGAIGSIVASYPLQLLHEQDPRMTATVDYLMRECFLDGAFFQEMIHSGLNAYLSLHVAQVLLRAGDQRQQDIVAAVAGLASPTGQWPEAIHPRTRGGCMGDGQHAWAAAEWVMMMRNWLVREEGDMAVLLSGIPKSWFQKPGRVEFGPAPTRFGAISVSAESSVTALDVTLDVNWRAAPQKVIICPPGFKPAMFTSAPARITLERD